MHPLTFAKINALGLVAFGLVAAAGSHPATAGPWSAMLDFARWPIDGLESAASPEARILSAVGGGIVAGWGLTLWWLLAGPIARGDAGARTIYLASLGLWFVIDSTGSIAAGWPLNAVLNVAFLLALAVPVLITRAPAPAHA